MLVGQLIFSHFLFGLPFFQYCKNDHGLSRPSPRGAAAVPCKSSPDRIFASGDEYDFSVKFRVADLFDSFKHPYFVCDLYSASAPSGVSFGHACIVTCLHPVPFICIGIAHHSTHNLTYNCPIMYSPTLPFRTSPNFVWHILRGWPRLGDSGRAICRRPPPLLCIDVRCVAGHTHTHRP